MRERRVRSVWAACVVVLVVGLAGWTGPGAAGTRASVALEVAAPAEVGVSAERLQRLDAGMQRMVDEGKLAGVVTLLARHGKLVHVDAVGVEDVETGARGSATRSAGSSR